MALDALPALSMRDRRSDQLGFARAMVESYATFGFAIVRDHGLDAALIAHAHFGDGNQMSHFFKNMAIVGGSLAFVAFGAGRYSLDGRK